MVPLTTTHPELASQWHPTKNGELTPDTLSSVSGKMVWWLGACGHEWEASVNSRAVKNRACVYCHGRKVLPGFNDLTTTHPDLAAQWHPTKNEELEPANVKYGSRQKVWWLGECGHEWEAVILNRASGNGCPECLGRTYTGVSPGYLSDNPELVAQLHPTKNNDVDVTTIRKFSVKKLWWICEHGHEWETSPSVRAGGAGCTYCAGNAVLVGFNDLATTHPEVAALWHPTKNSHITIANVSKGYASKVWWLGGCGHEWEAKPSSMIRGYRCPVCAGRQVLTGFNDVATKYPHLVSEWHPTKNEKISREVSHGSGELVWWLCEKNHEWEASVSNRGNLKSGCPVCNAASYVSQGEKEIAEYIRSLGFTVKTSVRDVITGELDVYVPEQQFAVEFNGVYWHSEKFKNAEYHKNKWLACKEQDIRLFQVWEDDWKRNPELVKRMIAHKLGVAVGGKVFARKTTVVPVTAETAGEFLTGNHLQGYRVAKYFGLKTTVGDTEKLVAVMGVATKGEDGLEIIRFASNAPVVGGFSKLLSHAVKQYENVEKVYSYSHNDHSWGDVYVKNGFELVHDGKPGYAYVRSGRGARENRLKFSPAAIKKNPSLVFEEGLSEKELAALNGLVKVWDAGSSLWVKSLN